MEPTEENLIEKMGQHNLTLLIACKICKKISRAWRNLYQIHFLCLGKWWKKIYHVTPQLSQNCDFSSQMSLIRFNFQNNHGNQSSGKPCYSPQSGQQSSNDTIFRGSHRSCSIKKVLLKFFAKFTGKHHCSSLFFNKLQAWGLQLYCKRDSRDSGVFLWI